MSFAAMPPRRRPLPTGSRRAGPFNIGLSSYRFDPATQAIRPYDTHTMIKHTKFVFQMARERSFVPGTVGYPLDVPPRIQFLTLYYLNCLCNPGVGAFALANTLDEMRFNMEIANVLGVPPVFGTEMISPLRLMGSHNGSRDVARHRSPSFSSCPSCYLFFPPSHSSLLSLFLFFVPSCLRVENTFHAGNPLTFSDLPLTLLYIVLLESPNLMRYNH